MIQPQSLRIPAGWEMVIHKFLDANHFKPKLN